MNDPNPTARLWGGLGVVVIGVVSVVVSLGLVLDSYEVDSPGTTSSAKNARPIIVVVKPTKKAIAKGLGKAAATAPPAGSDDTAANDMQQSASASSVVAILTPVVAGIAGIVGLFFGLSAAGSPRGREVEAKAHEQARTAEVQAKTAKVQLAAAEALLPGMDEIDADGVKTDEDT